jgi:uncharacterized membrane protein
LCGALGLWTLYYFAFLLLAVNVMVVGWWLGGWRRGRLGSAWLGRWLLAQGLVLLLYAPWLPVAWHQATQPPVPPWRDFVGLGQVLIETLAALSLGQSIHPTASGPSCFFSRPSSPFGLLQSSSFRGSEHLIPGCS